MRRPVFGMIVVVVIISLTGPLIGQTQDLIGQTQDEIVPMVEDQTIPEDVIDTGLVTLSNEYIRIIVNGEDENTGRYALETTEGDPNRVSDDGQPLIYGRPKPWTSYTSLRIDGEDYVFGGPTTKRSGLKGKYGTVIMPPSVQGDGIDTITQFGPIEVLQRLEFAVSSTTGYQDTARIIYQVTNTDTVPHQVGVRIMLDTLLGANDGAPFRFGEIAILGDARYEGEALPEFWQAFDSLSDPRVIAQGTLIGPDVTRPDRIIFSNWGNFADGLWEVDFQLGREFLRAGEFELDSAVGLYWDPKALQPGETRLFVTAYGMGGLSINPGELSLGVTAPATVSLGVDGRVKIPVIAYVENTGSGIGRDLSVSLRLPSGMAFAAESYPTRNIGFLRPSRSAQVSWDIIADQRLAGKTVSLRVEVTGPDIETVAVERRLRILGPPELRFKLTAEPSPVSDYYLIKGTVQNFGQSSAYNVESALKIPDGWVAAPKEKLNRFLGELEAYPSEKGIVSWQWQIKPTGIKPIPRITATLTGTNTVPFLGETQHLGITGPDPRIILTPELSEYQVNQLVTFKIAAPDIQGFNGIRLVLKYDPELLVYLDHSRGKVWIDAAGNLLNYKVSTDTSTGQITIEGYHPQLGGVFTDAGELGYLRFLAIQPGETRLDLLEPPTVFSSVADQKINVVVEPIIISD